MRRPGATEIYNVVNIIIDYYYYAYTCTVRAEERRVLYVWRIRINRLPEQTTYSSRTVSLACGRIVAEPIRIKSTEENKKKGTKLFKEKKRCVQHAGSLYRLRGSDRPYPRSTAAPQNIQDDTMRSILYVY